MAGLFSILKNVFSRAIHGKEAGTPPAPVRRTPSPAAHRRSLTAEPEVPREPRVAREPVVEREPAVRFIAAADSPALPSSATLL